MIYSPPPMVKTFLAIIFAALNCSVVFARDGTLSAAAEDGSVDKSGTQQ
jgi:hypothetical protein